MKKSIAMILCLVMALSLFCGCGPVEAPVETTEPKVEHTLQVPPASPALTMLT